MPPFSFPDSILAIYGWMEPFGFPIPFGMPLGIEGAVCDLFLLFVLTFLVGSVPWGLIISKVFYKQDVRKVGSGNIGTTNVMRTMGKAGGVAVFLLDFGKGFLSGFFGSLLAYAMLSSGYANGCIALAVSFVGCVLGHIFSPWLGFKGGKGIAVAIGCLFFALGYWFSFAELLLFAILVIVTRYVSIGSMVAAAVEPFIAIYVYWGNWLAIILMAIPAIAILWAHRSNFSRLMRGEESRIGSGSRGK